MGTGSGPRSEGFSHMALTGLPCAPRYVRPLRWHSGQSQRKRRRCPIALTCTHAGPCTHESLGAERARFAGSGPALATRVSEASLRGPLSPASPSAVWPQCMSI